MSDTLYRAAKIITALSVVLMVVVFVLYTLWNAKENKLDRNAPRMILTSNWPIENYIDPSPVGIKTPDELRYMTAALQLLLTVPAVVSCFQGFTFNDSSLVVINGLSDFIKEYTAGKADPVDIASFSQPILAECDKYGYAFDNNQASAPIMFIDRLIAMVYSEIHRPSPNCNDAAPKLDPFEMFISLFEAKFRCSTPECNEKNG